MANPTPRAEAGQSVPENPRLAPGSLTNTLGAGSRAADGGGAVMTAAPSRLVDWADRLAAGEDADAAARAAGGSGRPESREPDYILQRCADARNHLMVVRAYLDAPHDAESRGDALMAIHWIVAQLEAIESMQRAQVATHRRALAQERMDACRHAWVGSDACLRCGASPEVLR